MLVYFYLIIGFIIREFFTFLLQNRGPIVTTRSSDVVNKATVYFLSIGVMVMKTALINLMNWIVMVGLYFCKLWPSKPPLHRIAEPDLSTIFQWSPRSPLFPQSFDPNNLSTIAKGSDLLRNAQGVPKVHLTISMFSLISQWSLGDLLMNAKFVHLDGRNGWQIGEELLSVQWNTNRVHWMSVAEFIGESISTW